MSSGVAWLTADVQALDAAQAAARAAGRQVMVSRRRQLPGGGVRIRVRWTHRESCDMKLFVLALGLDPEVMMRAPARCRAAVARSGRTR